MQTYDKLLFIFKFINLLRSNLKILFGLNDTISYALCFKFIDEFLGDKLILIIKINFIFISNKNERVSE